MTALPPIRIHGHHEPSLQELAAKLSSLGYSVTGTDLAPPAPGEGSERGEVVVYDFRAPGQDVEAAIPLELFERVQRPMVVLHTPGSKPRQGRTPAPASSEITCELLEFPCPDHVLAAAIEAARGAYRLSAQGRMWKGWFQGFLAESWDAVLATNQQGKVTTAGPAAGRLVGRPARELHGLGIEEVLTMMLGPGGAAIVKDVRAALSGEAPAWEGQAFLHGGGRSEGEETGDTAVRLRAAAVKGAAGVASGGLLLAHPIDPITQRPWRPADAAAPAPAGTGDRELMALVAAGVGHLLNNALQVVIGHAELAGGGLPGKKAIAASIETIRKTAIKASRQVERMIEFTRSGASAKEQIELEQWVDETATRWTPNVPPGINVQRRLTGTPAPVLVRRDDLDRIADALVENAITAMPAGGTLTFAIEHGRRAANAGTSAGPAGPEGAPQIVLCVSDTGTGIDPEAQVRLFEPFFTTRAAGGALGVGLSAVYEIVQRCNGSIEVETQIGKGSTFKVCLPRATPRPDGRLAAPETVPNPLGLAALRAFPSGEIAPIPKVEATRQRDGGSETVLIADDDGLVRAIVRKHLQQLGYDVIEAPDAESALKAIGETTRRIRLLVTDIVMPGIGGMELVRRARANSPDLPVLYTTGYRSSTVAASIAADPRAAQLSKPFQASDLARIVRALLDGRTVNEQPA